MFQTPAESLASEDLAPKALEAVARGTHRRAVSSLSGEVCSRRLIDPWSHTSIRRWGMGVAVNVDSFVREETARMFADLQAQAGGVNTFQHLR